MTMTVSISDFRDDISGYLDRVKRGDTVVIKDEKKDEEIAEIKAKKKFDPIAYRRMLKRVSGTFTARDHPEWASLPKIVSWVNTSRKQAERSFDVPPRLRRGDLDSSGK